MSKNALKEGDVFPGEKISVIEVLESGEGTYELNGDVRSAELGKSLVDFKNRKARIKKKTKNLILPIEGLDVIAEVGSVMRRDARVDILLVDGKEVSKTYTGVIHASSVGRDYSKDMNLAVRNSDIIKAKIINTKNRLIILSITGSDYGVVYAYCSRCGTLLELQKSRLNCPKCGRVERRKISKNYGKEELV